MAKQESNIRKIEEIDEEALLASIANMSEDRPKKSSTQPKKVIQEVQEEETEEDGAEETEITPKAKKTRGSSSYQSTFLNPKELKDRRSVYISADLHETILAIVAEIAVKSMTVGAFIDTIIRQHLEDNKEEINNLYRRKRDALIK